VSARAGITIGYERKHKFFCIILNTDAARMGGFFIARVNL